MSGDMMAMPDKWEDFLHDCEFKDKQEVYTNGSMLIQSFRVVQMMEAYYQPLKRRLILATSELAAEMQKNYLLEANNEHFKEERDAVVKDLHNLHSLCMNIGGCCPECGAQIDELLDAAWMTIYGLYQPIATDTGGQAHSSHGAQRRDEPEGYNRRTSEKLF